MVWQVPPSTIQDATVVPLGESDSVLVMSNVGISSRIATTIRGTGSNHQAIVDGSVASAGAADAIWLGDSATLDFGQKVTVSAGAFVRALDYAGSAIGVYGYDCEVVNHGTLSSAADMGIALNGVNASTSSTVINTGWIEAGRFGVARVQGGTETIVLNNSGTISGDQASYGTYNTASTGIDLVTNTGKMIGDVLLDGGDDLYDGRLGTIDGDVFGGVGGDRLFAGAGDNRLFGGDDNDTLMGGAGADYLSGGTGSDRAAYSSATKAVIVSLANPAINSGDAAGDTFNSIENLTGSDFNDILNGNSAKNAINGGGGNDFIKGYLGNDMLTGYSGADTFIFNTALNASTNVDTITDYSVAADTIQLDNAFFAALTATGTLASAAFRSNTTGLAGDTSDRIIYESDTGELYYDANGTGSGGGILFAKLATGLSLTNADFVVI